MYFYKKHIPYLILFVVVGIPVALWLGVQTIHVGNARSLLSGLGEICGIVGVILFALALILSARPIVFDKLFAGLNVLYSYHNKIGQIAFILLLVHPLFLLARYASSFKEAALFFSFSGNWQQNFGIISLYLSILVIIFTLYLRPKYHIWKYVHKFFGVALFLGALHIYLSPSYVLHKNVVLNLYVLGFAIAGICVWFYKSVLGKSFASTHNYIVKNAIPINNKVIEITLAPTSGKMVFEPGQFVFVKFKKSLVGAESHPFSIVSVPEDEELKIAVKALGDYTSALYSKLEVWTEAVVEGPFGVFSYKNKNAKQLWIAGGVGVTPFISMAQSLADDDNFDIAMYYVTKNKYDAPYLNLLLSIAEMVRGFRIIPFFSDESGFITAKYIAEQINDFKERSVLLCAPPAMIYALKEGFINIGMQSDNLYSEEFNF